MIVGTLELWRILLYPIYLLCENWAIAEYFPYRVPLKDSNRFDYHCRDHKIGCFWRVLTSIFKGEIRVRIVASKHTCAGFGQTSREVSNTQSWLRRAVPNYLVVTWDTEVWEIIECIQMHYDVQVSREASRLVKSMLVKDQIQH